MSLTLSRILNPSVSTEWSYIKRMSNFDSVVYFNVDGLSIANDYIPYYSLWVNHGVYTKGVNKVIHYGLLDLTNLNNYNNYSNPSKRYNTLFDALKNSSIPVAFKSTSMANPVFAMKGMLYEVKDDMPVIHLLFTIKSDYAHKHDFTTPISVGNFKLYVSYDFINNPIYKTMYTKLYKEILSGLSAQNIDMVFTNDISSKIFNTGLDHYNYNSIIQMNQQFKEFNTQMLNG